MGEKDASKILKKRYVQTPEREAELDMTRKVEKAKCRNAPDCGCEKQPYEGSDFDEDLKNELRCPVFAQEFLKLIRQEEDYTPERIAYFENIVQGYKDESK